MKESLITAGVFNETEERSISKMVEKKEYLTWDESDYIKVYLPEYIHGRKETSCLGQVTNRK